MRKLFILACGSLMLSACYGGVVIFREVREIEVTRVVEVTSIPSLSLGENNVYIVQAGDTPLAIATRFGITVEDLIAANGLDNPDFLFAGQRLTIPIGTLPSTPEPTPTKTPIVRIQIESPGNLLSEAISITNDSNQAINLQGWQIQRVGGPTYTFDSVSIFPGGNLSLYSRIGNDTSVAIYWGQLSPVWQSGDIVTLLGVDGRVEAAAVIP